MKNKKLKIAQSFQKGLLLLVIAAFAVTTVFLWVFQTKLSKDNAVSLLELNISDVRQDIIDASDENLLKLTRQITNDLSAEKNIGSDILYELLERYDVTEINYVDPEGIIKATTYPDFMDYDMASGEQSAEFLVLLSGEKEFVQSYQPVSYDASISRKYGGVVLEDGGFIQVGYGAERFRKDIDELVVGVTRNRHVGKEGCLIIIDEEWNIVSDRHGNEGKNIKVAGIKLDDEEVIEGGIFTAEVYGEPCYCLYKTAEGYFIIAAMPKSEAALSRNVSVGVTTVMQVIIFASLFVLVFFLVKHLVVDNIYKVNDSLSAIAEGKLDTVVDVRSHEEFNALSDDINATVDTLKHYISDAKARIDAELAFAKAVQHSALPSVFPPYPNRKEFDLFASMHTAKEVGGDFYDFYFADDKTLAFLVADVSGKGIPAAMFMMTAKTLIKNFAESGMKPEEVFRLANEKLCEGNEAEMFVTAWMGFLDTETGKVTYVNAGHNPPLIKRSGKYEYLRSRTGFILAGMEGMRYKSGEFFLEPGDGIYLYTDGVTEAVNTENVLYGEERLLSVLNKNADESVSTVCEKVKADVDSFAGETPQFDDITMLCLNYNGFSGEDEKVKSVTLDATIANIETVTDFVNEILEEAGASMKAQMQIDIAIDEIFSNIANYAYGDETGTATVSVEINKDPLSATITFADSGTPYDPLSADDPDTTLSAEERPSGGLGVFMVKKSMNETSYEYKEGKNIFTIKKNL